MPELERSALGECQVCEGQHTTGSGRPNGVDCRCGRHFHFGDDLWVRTDKCIVCPSCERALSPLDFDHEGNERGYRTPAGERCPRDSGWCDGVMCRADQVGYRPDCPNADPVAEESEEVEA